MKYYRISAKLCSPLMIQQNRQAYAPNTLPYLPGSTLRGALAAKYLREGNLPEDKVFRKLFLDQPVSFPDLLPAPDSDTVSSVLPVTAVSCKRKPGFRAADMHGVADMLALTAFSRISGKAAETEEWECPECKEDMKPFSGFWKADKEAPVRFVPTVSSQRHTGISRLTGAVAESVFFMTQTISDFYKDAETKEYKPQHLNACIYLGEEELEYLSPLLEGPVFAGADRTRGFGELDLGIHECSAPVPDIENWNQAFQKKLGKYGQVPEGIYFSITLQSHAVLTDIFLRPVSDIPELEISDIEKVMKVVKPETIRGWQSAWGLAKPDDMAVSMGSVYLYRYTGENMDKLKQTLSELLKKGIGLRKEEGFGKISVCDFLHIREGIL